MTGAIDLIRAEVMAQPPHERLAYALDLLDWYLDPIPAWFQGAAAMGLDLTLGDLRVLHRLDRQRGAFVSYDALIAARAPDEAGDDPGDLANLSRSVANIRRALKARAHPALIANAPGIGYRLDAPVTWRIERAGA